MVTPAFRLFAGLTLVAALGAACSTNPLEPQPIKLRTGLLFDNDPIPCDSTIVTDGTCRNGFIIPWSLQGR